MEMRFILARYLLLLNLAVKDPGQPFTFEMISIPRVSREALDRPLKYLSDLLNIA